MTDVTAVVRVEHPDIVLTETVTHDSGSTVRSVSEAGTDPTSGKFLYHVESADFDRFEAGLREDHTVGAFERVVDVNEGEAIYSFEYTDAAKLISPVVAAANGVILDMENDGAAWMLTVWMPERTGLVDVWDYARQHDVAIDLLRVNEYEGLATTDAGLTDSQREALLVAFETGYFEEPRNADLGDVAAELDISRPAASGLLRRGLRRLVVATLVDDGDATE